MKLMENIFDLAKANKKKIVLAEGEEERNIRASEEIIKDGIADIILVGSESVIKESAAKFGVNLAGVEIVDLKLQVKLQAMPMPFMKLERIKELHWKKQIK